MRTVRSSSFLRLFVLSLLSFAAVAVVARPALAVTSFTVNSTGDGGDSGLKDNACNDGTGNCTLRAAIQQANGSAGTQTINFAIPVLPPPFTVTPVIKPATALPAVSQPAIIDASTQTTTHHVILDGSAISGGADGFTLTAAGCTVRGFTIQAFALGRGIESQGASATIAGNILGSVTGSGGDRYGIVSSGTLAVIGGTTVADRNVISGNSIDGIVDENSGDLIEGNYIGSNAAGIAAAPNGNDGINVYSSGSVIGPGNVISGNTHNGVEFESSLAHGDTLQGNLIGVNAAGTAALANGRNGVYVHGDANTITVGAGNVVSGNTWDGVAVAGATSTGVTIKGNLIGTNAAGTAGIPNENGVDIVDVSGTVVGGATGADRNVISGNQFDGALIQQVSVTTTGNVVEGNYIGTNAGGTAQVPNHDGVLVMPSADGNTVGGSTAGAGNLVSGNLINGVDLQSDGNSVLGNLIGTDSSGTAAVANGGDGVDVTGSGNALDGNLISGNGVEGVYLTGDLATGNTLTHNYIGTDDSGAAALGNADGVFVDASNNTIGGTTADDRNVISGNSGSGIVVQQISSSSLPAGNVFQGNYIGLTGDGAAPLGNTLNGILLFDAGANTVGGTGAGAGNVVSDNARGIYVSTSDPGNVVYGNLVGTDASGAQTTGFGNDGPGIRVEDTTGTTIGGTSATARNVISGNGAEGIDLEGATSTQIVGNYIGTDVTGTLDRGNLADGIVANGSAKNTIGGTHTGAGNLISGNDGNGIHLNAKTAKSNKVLGNLIGTQKDGSSPLGNNLNGILVEGKAGKTTIGGTTAKVRNVIADNGSAGVFVDAGTGNAIRENAIYANGALGIDLHPTGVNVNDAGDPDKGANLGQNYPVVTSASSSGGTTTVAGTLNSAANATFQVDVFWGPTRDPSLFGEGQTFLGTLTVTTNGSGNATFSSPFTGTVPAGSWVTMTATDAKGNTSEFAQAKKST